MQVGALDRRGSLPVGLQGNEARLDVRLAELPGSEQRGIGLLQQFAGDVSRRRLAVASMTRCGMLAGLAGNGERDSSGSTSDATAGLRLRGSDQPGGRENPRVDGADQRLLAPVVVRHPLLAALGGWPSTQGFSSGSLS